MWTVSWFGPSPRTPANAAALVIAQGGPKRAYEGSFRVLIDGEPNGSDALGRAFEGLLSVFPEIGMVSSR